MTTWDPTCFPVPVRPTRVVSRFDCSCDGVAYVYGTAEVVNSNPWAPITLQIRVAAGSAPVQNWRILAYALPPSVPEPITAAEVAYVQATFDPVLSLVMPSLPAGAQVNLDGVRDRYELITGGQVLDARRYVFSEGGRPFRLPVVEPCARLTVIVLANACNGAVQGASWSVEGMATLTMAGGPGGSVGPAQRYLPLAGAYSMRRDTAVPATPLLAEDLVAFGSYPAASWNHPGWNSAAAAPVALADSATTTGPYVLGVEQTSTTRTPVHQLHVGFDTTDAGDLSGKRLTLRLPYSGFAPGTLLNDGPGGASGPNNLGTRPYLSVYLVRHYDLDTVVGGGSPRTNGNGWLSLCWTKPAAVALPTGHGRYLAGRDAGGAGYFAGWATGRPMRYLTSLEDRGGYLEGAFDVDDVSVASFLYPGDAWADAVASGLLGLFVCYAPPGPPGFGPFSLSGAYTITGARLLVTDTPAVG